MERTVYLTQGLESGTWMFTLPGANRLSVMKEVNGIEYPTTVRQRVSSSSQKEEEATYDYHYVTLDGVDTDLEREEVIELGFPEQATLNVETGEIDLSF